jgi:hypothetical protein
MSKNNQRGEAPSNPLPTSAGSDVAVDPHHHAVRPDFSAPSMPANYERGKPATDRGHLFKTGARQPFSD